MAVLAEAAEAAESPAPEAIEWPMVTQESVGAAEEPIPAPVSPLAALEAAVSHESAIVAAEPKRLESHHEAPVLLDTASEREEAVEAEYVSEFVEESEFAEVRYVEQEYVEAEFVSESAGTIQAAEIVEEANVVEQPRLVEEPAPVPRASDRPNLIELAQLINETHRRKKRPEPARV